MVACKPTYEMVFGLSGVNACYPQRLKNNSSDQWIDRFELTRINPKRPGTQGTHQKSIHRHYEWLFSKGEPGCKSTNIATTKSFQELLPFVWESVNWHGLFYQTPKHQFPFNCKQCTFLQFVFGYPQNMEIPWVSTKHPPQQPHIICHSGNTASGANVSVPKGMRSSSLANFVEWQAIFFFEFIPLKICRIYSDEKKLPDFKGRSLFQTTIIGF